MTDLICSNCGKQIEENCLFCTECGSDINLTKKQTQSNAIIKNDQIREKIDNFINKFGDIKINKFLSLATIISIISIRIFGFIVITALITVINSILIYYNYRKNSKMDMKMILWSIAVLVAGILVSI